MRAYTAYIYNDLGQRVSVNWGDPNNLTSMGWQYQTLNAGGQIMAVTDYQGNVSRFAYDGAGQLTGESLSGGWRSPYDYTYAYDSNGNRTSKRDNLTAQTDTYTYYANSDKLHNVFSASGQKGYTYDGAGNVLNVYRDVGGTQTLAWNPDGTLASYTDINGTQTYGYNGLGLRLSKSDGFLSQQVTDGTAPGAALLTDGRATYTPGISESRAGGSRFYLPDARGTVHVALDANYTAQDATYTDAFGNRLSGSGYNDPTPFGWGGLDGYQQDASGLSLLGHRYYDPTTGRFLSQDPAGQGMNWYAYCGNSPVNATDPSGLAPTPNLAGQGPTAMEMNLMSGAHGNDDIYAEMADFDARRWADRYNKALGDYFTEQVAAAQAAATPPSYETYSPDGGGGNKFSKLFLDYIFSLGVSGGISVGTHHYSLSAGLAFDLNNFEAESTVTISHLHGIGVGWGVSPYVGLGSGSWGGFNGFSNQYSLILPIGGATYNYNDGYKGLELSLPGLGTEGGAFMGRYGYSVPPSVRGGSYTWHTPPTTSYLFGPITYP